MSDQPSATTEVGLIAFKSSVGVAVSAFTLNSMVAILTAIFLLMQMVDFAWKRKWPQTVWGWVSPPAPKPAPLDYPEGEE